MNNTTRTAGGQYLLDISPTGHVRPWRAHKMANQLLSMAYQTIDPGKAARLSSCATEVSFSTDAISGERRLFAANFCRVRLCPMCQWRRSLKVYGQTKRIMEAIQQDRPMAYIFVTLSVRNVSGDDLGKTIDHLMASYKRLIERKAVGQAVKGYYRALEITHNVDYQSADYDTFHPHFHAVFAVNPSYFTDKTYLSQARWTSLWQEAARLDYTPIVDVRRVKGSTAEAVAEAAKYTVKPGDYILPDDWDLTIDTVRLLDKALDRRRLVAYGGIMADWHKRLNLDDADDGDLVHTDTTAPLDRADVPKIWYAWHSGYCQYCRIIEPH